MYNKHNLLPLKFVSKLSLKPELASVAFYPNRTIGTDSFRLLEVSSLNPEENSTRTGTTEPTIIHKDELKQIKLKKGETTTIPNLPTIEDRTYPDVDIVMKEDLNQAYATIKVDGKLLGEMLVAMATMNPFGQVELRVPVNTPYKAIRLTATDNKTKQVARGLVMPQNR